VIAIRIAKPSDAANLLELKHALDRETDFMLIEPGERRESAQLLAADLELLGGIENSTVLLAEVDGELIGYVEARGGTFQRNRHSAYVVIGVRAAAAGRGVGTALLRELITWAERHDVHRLELTVMAHNQRAIALYRRLGFELEGTRRHSVRVGGSFVDELAMARLQPPAAG
jgi:RimJ/RimL family protein N-acetyltransferase